jgi:hypothetical protein
MPRKILLKVRVMRVRSTGLGKQEMVAHFDHLEKNGDYLIMKVKVSEPVIWKIRIALTRQDIFAILGGMVKSIPNVISTIMAGNKKDKKFSDPGW